MVNSMFDGLAAGKNAGQHCLERFGEPMKD